MRKIVICTLLLILFGFGSISAKAKCGFKSSDWLVRPETRESVVLGDDFYLTKETLLFKAKKSVILTTKKDVIVTVPFSYFSSFTNGVSYDFLAYASAASARRVFKLAKDYPEDYEFLNSKIYLGSKRVKTVSGNNRVAHLFRLANKRVAYVYSYFDDEYGILSVVKVCPT
jgi:hypothetical protein